MSVLRCKRKNFGQNSFSHITFTGIEQSIQGLQQVICLQNVLKKMNKVTRYVIFPENIVIFP